MIIKKDFPLSQILWYKLGGTAQYLIEAESSADVKDALEFVEKNSIKKVFFCGLGSNLIFSDDYFDGAVVRIVKSNTTGRDFNLKGERVSVFAGVSLDSLINYAIDNNLAGLEWAGGLPGTVGAGIRGNVGAFGREIKDSVYSADVLERVNGRFKIKTIHNDELNFSYRNSLVKENKGMIVVSGEFQLKHGDSEETAKARRIYSDSIRYRKEHHPIEFPTCGSVFKNIIREDEVRRIIEVWPDVNESVINKWHGKVPMGYIIKRLGFAGMREGAMQVSEMHANFIVNLGDGHARDVLAIIRRIEDKAQETFNIAPEREVEIVY